MRTKWVLIFLAAAVITGCEFKCSTGDDSGVKTKEVSSDENDSPLKGAAIGNDIVLDASNVKVSEAYLMNEDRQRLEANEVKVGEKITCVVILDTGWTKTGSQSFIGASEKVLTNDGRVILDIDDLLKDYTESGISATDAEAISIRAVVTEKEPGVDNYKVQFKIWDKKGDGEVTGSFKFKVN